MQCPDKFLHGLARFAPCGGGVRCGRFQKAVSHSEPHYRHITPAVVHVRGDELPDGRVFAENVERDVVQQLVMRVGLAGVVDEVGDVAEQQLLDPFVKIRRKVGDVRLRGKQDVGCRFGIEIRHARMPQAGDAAFTEECFGAFQIAALLLFACVGFRHRPDGGAETRVLLHELQQFLAFPLADVGDLEDDADDILLQHTAVMFQPRGVGCILTAARPSGGAFLSYGV